MGKELSFSAETERRPVLSARLKGRFPSGLLYRSRSRGVETKYAPPFRSSLRSFRRAAPFGAELKLKVEPRSYALGITVFLPYVGRFFIVRAGGHSPLSPACRPIIVGAYGIIGKCG